MIARLPTLAIVLFWAATMGWLIRHDVLPGWTAQDAPRFAPGDWLTEEVQRSQARIENRYGHRIGTVWAEHSRIGSLLHRRDVLWLGDFPLLPPLRMDSETDFAADGQLDTFVLRIDGHSERVELHSERISESLAFRLDIGTRMQMFKVDSAVAGMVADAFRPFPTLPNLAVGQSWRMQVINPLAVLSGVGAKLMPMLVQVTGKEPMAADHGVTDCFVVESGGAKAWVDSRGVVLRQEMELPYGGKLTIIAEPFDLAEFERVQALDLTPK